MLLMFGMALFVIEGLASGYLIVKIIQAVCEDVPFLSDGSRLRFYNMMSSGWTAVIINLFVSVIMNYFTSAGMIAGFANLGSSIILSVVLPWGIRKWYPPEEMLRRVHQGKIDRKLAKAQYKAANRAARMARKEAA